MICGIYSLVKEVWGFPGCHKANRVLAAVAPLARCKTTWLSGINIDQIIDLAVHSTKDLRFRAGLGFRV